MNKANQWLTLVANAGVIAGLVFLGFEIRQNTNIAKASAYEEWLRFQAGACIHYRTAVENEIELRFTTPGFRKYLQETCKADASG